MKGRITLISPDFPIDEVTEYSREIRLGELHRLVGGYFQLVPYWISVKDGGGNRVPCRVFCDEDGKRKGLARNDTATALWREAIACDFHHRGTPQDDYVVGPIAIVTGDDEFMEAL